MMKSIIKTKHSLFVMLFSVIILLSGTNFLNAQPQSAAIMAQVNSELQRRGLNQEEVKTRLLQEGIDLENVPPEELPQYQPRVTAILDKMEAEKKAGASQSNNQNSQPATITSQAEIINSEPTIIESNAPATTTEEAIAEAKQRVIQNSVTKLEVSDQIYGHSLFNDQSLKVFRTTDGALAPDSYVLGAGDEIRITIFGLSQTDMQLTINSEGYIQPTGMAKIFLQGLTLLQGRELLYQRLSSSYTFRSDQFALTIATARTIMVNIFGETNIKGGFTLSALNSAFNALSAAGGPTQIGSVRNIEIIRGNKRSKMDLYAFMNDPAIQYKFELQQNDIIYVPVVQNLISIEGAVKRPMQYELLPKEDLSDLIKYAGGLNVNAYPDFVQIQRYTNGEIQLIEHKLSDVINWNKKIDLQNGDIVRIKSIEKPLENFVNITGSVYYTGRYDINANPTLSTLLANAQLSTQAKTDLIIIERTRPDNTVEILTVPWNELQNSKSDFTLMPRDQIKVPELADYRDTETISVTGYVRAPFSKSFALSDKITVKQAIELAGGVKADVYPIAYVFRKNLFNSDKMEYLKIELENADEFILRPGDQLNIYDNSLFANIGEVKIFGAVKNPQEFTYDPSLSITDLITASGGFTLGAAFNRVEVFRTVLSATEKARTEMIAIEVDSSYQLLSPKTFALQPYDQVMVRLTPDFNMGRSVEITGEINYPGIYVLESKQTHLSELIKKSGGLLDGADAKGSKLFRTFDNRGFITMDVNQALHHKKNKKFDPVLFKGDVINIGRLENIVSIRKTATRFDNYSDEFNDGVLDLVFQGEKSARWYINNYAGGFEKRADKRSVVVILKNGQVKPTRSFIGIKTYPKVETGALITLNMKPPKEKKNENREKTSWGNIWSSTLSAVTTALTVVVLAGKL